MHWSVSHGHFDHYGGLIGFLQKYRSALPADVKLYAGGEDTSAGYSGAPGALAEFGALDRREWLRTRSQSFWRKPTVVADHAFTTVRSRGRGSKECCRTRTSDLV